MWSLSCCKGRINSSDFTEAVDELDGAVSATTGLGSKEEQKASERHLSLSDYTPRPRSSSTSEIEKSRRKTRVNYTSRNELENQVSLASSQIQVISNPGALDISEPAHRTLPSSEERTLWERALCPLFGGCPYLGGSPYSQKTGSDLNSISCPINSPNIYYHFSTLLLLLHPLI